MQDVRIFSQIVEEQAYQQIMTLAKLPAFNGCKIRIMPDTHAGAGCVIGFTAYLGDKVIPNVVGVDIGCGMLTVKLCDKSIDLSKLDNVIRQYIPSGKSVHDVPIVNYDNINNILCLSQLKNKERFNASIGTLGGGNHFIEIDKDKDDNLYLIIHTGSRNLGKQVADFYQKVAINYIRNKDVEVLDYQLIINQLKSEGRASEISQAIADFKSKRAEHLNNNQEIPNELCYIENDERLHYLHDMKICQEYAILNRKTIADIIIKQMRLTEDSRFETVHNYIDHDLNIIRKGAISSQLGEKLLIPINMRDGCIVGVGKGNPEWNYSAPHGAGRVLSRSQARAKLNLDDYVDSMDGIFTTSVCDATIDESPMAYKPIEAITDYISESVDILEIIKPIYNFKACE